MLSILYHDSAALLYFARQYDLAIPLFQEAIALGSSFPHTFWWLAASLWATTRDRATVLAWLREGWCGRRNQRYELQDMPEFADVADELNTRALKNALADTDPSTLVGKSVSITGAFTLDNIDDIVVTPVFLTMK